MKILIAADNHVTTQPLASMLEELGMEAVCAYTIEQVVVYATENRLTTVIIAPDFSHVSDLLSNTVLSPRLPLLLMAEVKGTPFQRYDSQKFIDYLPVEPTLAELQHKVEFAHKIHRQTLQLHEASTTIETLRDHLEQSQRSIEHHSQILDHLATRDGLTGLYNRHYLSRTLPQAIQDAQANQQKLSVLLIDIDLFHEINMSKGQQYGDSILNEFAARLTSQTEPHELCFRFSGENFLVLLPSTDLDSAIKRAEIIRALCKDKLFVHGDIKKSITISIGVASLIADIDLNYDELISMADAALYQAKSEGRDRVIAYQFNRQSDDTSSRNQNIVQVRDTITRILDKTRNSAISSLQLLAKDIIGKEHKNHIKLVREYVQIICESLHLPEPIIQTFKNAITLHTSIRFLLHDEMINKKEKFTPADRTTMNDFPYKLVELIDLFDFFSNERSILLCHGEKFNGTGYPEGLRGEEIPLGARIFCLVDALAAMNSDRPHRKRLQPETILEELANGAGSQFDPTLVMQVIDIIQSKQLLDIQDSILDTVRNQLLSGERTQ